MKKIIFYFVILFLLNGYLFSKGNGNPDDIKNPDGNIQDHNINKDLRMEKKDDRYKGQVNEERKEFNPEREKNIKELKSNTDILQKEIRKNITFLLKTGKNNLENREKIKKECFSLIEKMNSFINSFSNKEAQLIKSQIENVKKITQNINNIVGDIDKNENLNKIIELNKKLEKEINKIERQIRAIEWILSEE
ncbi:MAG TPA: hypothetical protein PLE45_01630 [Spirochaetota bacterium]|nr:hypothetical protein [Spirochaetota bacterium]HOL57813.1 hypothetical protein [Spirochaetota bacterium]HPP04950.1 hypothetical protein [Spirochaetota bacterium]